jgi:hypothetical protein
VFQWVVVILGGLNDNRDTCMQAVGFIDKQVLPLEDAWYVEYLYELATQKHIDRYRLVNKLKRC